MGYALLTADIEYRNNEPMIHSLAHKWFKKNPHKVFEDIICDINYLFCKAYENFDSSKGTKFSTYLYFFIKTGLIDLLRKEVVRNRDTYANHDQAVTEAHGQFDQEDILEDMSSDAKFLCDLVIDPPTDLKEIIVIKGGTPRNYRSSIKDHLRNIGWTASRIRESFSEIRFLIGN